MKAFSERTYTLRALLNENLKHSKHENVNIPEQHTFYIRHQVTDVCLDPKEQVTTNTPVHYIYTFYWYARTFSAEKTEYRNN